MRVYILAILALFGLMLVIFQTVIQLHTCMVIFKMVFKDGKIAIKGWTETADLDAFTFCEKLQKIGVKTVICTDISKDGAMQGTNHELYERLHKTYNIDIIASGGVSSIEDVKALTEMGLYGAIIGKAFYAGTIDLAEAVKLAAE